jgi:hypothetical protein
MPGIDSRAPERPPLQPLDGLGHLRIEPVGNTRTASLYATHASW